MNDLRTLPTSLAALPALLLLTILGACGAPSDGVGDGAFDVLIRGGRVVDGTGNPWFRADVGIRDDQIVAVGRLEVASAEWVVDAEGLIVAPGFIDLHTHSYMPLLADGDAQSKVREVVTLDVIGESSTVAPRDSLPPRLGDVVVDWTTFTEYFRRLEEGGISMNVISQVSAMQVQDIVKGYESRPATDEELERMRELTACSM